MWVRVLRGFVGERGETVGVDAVVEFSDPFAREMIAANKAVETGPPKPKRRRKTNDKNGDE